MELYTKDAARLLNTTEETVYHWIRARELPAHKTGGRTRFNLSELLEWATTRGETVSAELAHAFAESGDSQTGLADALRAGGLLQGVSGPDKFAVLRAAVAAMPLPATVSRDLLLSVLLARETLGSTAVGQGVAIPHPRNPLVMAVPAPQITLAYLDHPVDFAAPDQQPVDTLFLLVSVSVKGHLRLLSRIAFALQDTGVRDALRGRAPLNRVLSEIARVETGLREPAVP